MNITYCVNCEHMKNKKAGTGTRYYCEKEDKWLPLNTTAPDLESRYCINGHSPRKENNTRRGNNEF